jgi:hypothetical protein
MGWEPAAQHARDAIRALVGNPVTDTVQDLESVLADTRTTVRFSVSTLDELISLL